jgi:hypothetical protein
MGVYDRGATTKSMGAADILLGILVRTNHRRGPMATGGKGCSCSSSYDAISKAGEERIDKVNLLPFDLSKFLIGHDLKSGSKNSIRSDSRVLPFWFFVLSFSLLFLF